VVFVRGILHRAAKLLKIDSDRRSGLLVVHIRTPV
jgi:hypothetical protein